MRWEPTIATIWTNYWLDKLVCRRSWSIPRSLNIIYRLTCNFTCSCRSWRSWYFSWFCIPISLFIATSRAFLGVCVSFNNSLWISPSCILAMKTSRMIDSSWLPKSQFKDNLLSSEKSVTIKCDVSLFSKHSIKTFPESLCCYSINLDIWFLGTKYSSTLHPQTEIR